MSQHIFSIIDTVNEASASLFAHDAVGQANLRDQLWNRSVFMRGVTGAGEDGQGTQLSFLDDPGGELQLIVHLKEADAVEHAGTGNYLAMKFADLVEFATAQRFDMLLNAGDGVATIPYGLLMKLRDIAMLGQTEDAMSDQERVMLSLANRVVTARAVEYCALHQDIDSFNVVLLEAPGLKTVTVMTLDTHNFEAHEEALHEIADGVYLPGWRIIVTDGKSPPDSPLAGFHEAPLYQRGAAKQKSLSWWQKIFKPAKDPLRDASVVEVKLLPG